MAVSLSVSPMLSVRRSAEAVEFYKAAFGAVEVYRMQEDPAGGVVSRLAIGVSEFWVTEESPEHGSPGPESLGGAACRFVLTVPDPETVVARAISSGAKEVWPVGEGHGWRLGRITDPYGFDWEIGFELSAQE